MTPSPPLSPRSTSSSHPSSSPTDTASHDIETLRQPFAHADLPPISQISFQPPILPPMGAPAPTSSTYLPNVSELFPKRSRHGKQKSEDSTRPSSSGSSQQAMEEDNPVGHDDDATPSGGTPGDPESSSQPLKKKRTRTLTTPHQSAVLHALLAQSRFPTTAMREEVGRSIGLSARKVQVWFQNQRQKARKPRSAQSAAPLSRPPQFGPFRSGAPPENLPVAEPSGASGSSGPFQAVGPAETRQPPRVYSIEPPSGHAHPRGLPTSPQYPPSHLSEYPGYAPNRQPMQQQQPYPHPSIGYNVEHPPGSTTRGGGRGYTPPPLGLPLPPGPQYAPQAPYPPDPYARRPLQGPSITRSSELPIMLPPLRFDQPRGNQVRTTLPPPPLHAGDPHFPSDTPRSPSFLTPSSASSSHLPFNLSHPPPRRSESIPPPFTLQPQPQWGPSHPISGPTLPMHPPGGISQRPYGIHGYPRPRTNSDPTRALPPLSILDEQEHPRQPALLTQPWPRPEPPAAPGSGTGGRRFDPVHSVLHQGDRDEERTREGEGGNGSRRNRHTYDFARPSGRMATSSPPHPPDRPHGEKHRQSD